MKREEGHMAISENERIGGAEDRQRYAKKNLYSLKTSCSPFYKGNSNNNSSIYLTVSKIVISMQNSKNVQYFFYTKNEAG